MALGGLFGEWGMKSVPAARFFRERLRLTRDLAGQLLGHVRDASQARKQAVLTPLRPNKSGTNLGEWLKLRAAFCDVAAWGRLCCCWLAWASAASCEGWQP